MSKLTYNVKTPSFKKGQEVRCKKTKKCGILVDIDLDTMEWKDADLLVHFSDGTKKWFCDDEINHVGSMDIKFKGKVVATVDL
jgi:hypothetical protein